MARFGAGAWLPALWLAAAAAMPAVAQQAAPAVAERAAAEPELEQILEAGEYRYARSRRDGVFVSFDGGLTWQPRSAGLPHRVVYPFPDPPEYAAVTSLSADPNNPRRLAATTASGVYLTANGGTAWQRVATGQVHPHAYFTSVALSPHDPGGMLLGTSFHGIYETTDGGANWHHLTSAIRFLTDRSLFYEEVAGLSYDPGAPRAMVVLAGFDGGVFYVTDRFAEERNTPGTGLLRFTVPAMATIQVAVVPAGEAWELRAGTVDTRWRLTADGSWAPIGAAEALRRGVPLQPQDPAPAPAADEPAPASLSTPPESADPAADAAPTPPRATEPTAGTATTLLNATEPASDTVATPPGATDSAPDIAATPPGTTDSAPDTAATPPGATDSAPDTAATPPGATDSAPDTAATPPAAAAPGSVAATAVARGSVQAALTAPDAEPPAVAADDAGRPGPPATGAQADAPTVATGPAHDPVRPAAPADAAGSDAAMAAADTAPPAPAASTATSADTPPGESRTSADHADPTPMAAAESGPAAAAAHEHSGDSVPGIAAGLPQVPPPECTTTAQPGGDGATQPVAAEHTGGGTQPGAANHTGRGTQPVAAEHTGGGTQPVAAEHIGGGTNAGPAMAAKPSRQPVRDAAVSQSAAGAGQVAALPPHLTAARHTDGGPLPAHQVSAAAAASGGAAGTDAHPCDDEHLLAAGEPGWIPGPGGIGAHAPLETAALRNGIYIRADRAVEALPEYLDLLARHGLDSIVIDFKTDRGRLTYDSELPLAHTIGAAPGPIKLDRLIADAHAAGIYVIARLVVFKDPFLYDWDSHRLAIWDAEQDGPWRHLVPAGDDSGDLLQREHWVDPFAPEVWQYNVAVAEELAARGVDEIQFDYIRFPSDGPTERATYRYRRPGMRRMDAIESFLALARERLQVPISTDLFGFNSWYRAGNFIGQDIGVLSEYADVISPMFYPSHFPHHFLDDRGYNERAYAIYEAGVRRAQRMVQGRAHIRPYVQAFLIGRELRMEEDEYGRYLIRQLDGNRAAAGSGFTLWNASNRYYMVTEPLQPYFDTRGEETP